MTKILHKIFTLFPITLSYTIIWLLGLLFTLKGPNTFSTFEENDVFFNFAIVYLIFFLEFAFLFLDISVKHNHQDFSSKIVELFGLVLIDFFIVALITVFYVDCNSDILLYISLLPICFLKYLCLSLQINVEKYFSNEKSRGNKYIPSDVFL